MKNKFLIILFLITSMMITGCDKDDDKGNCRILSFVTSTPQATGVIDEDKKTVVMTVPLGTDVSAVVPTIEVSAGATVTPASGIPQNFENEPVEYIVTNGESNSVYKAYFNASGEDSGSGDCKTYYNVKCGKITYRVTNGDEIVTYCYVFDNYGRKENLYVADECGGYSGEIFDHVAKLITIYGHSGDGDDCEWNVFTQSSTLGMPLWNYNAQLNALKLASQFGVGTYREITEIICGKACRGASYTAPGEETVTILQWNCLLFKCVGQDGGEYGDVVAVDFTTDIPSDVFNAASMQKR